MVSLRDTFKYPTICPSIERVRLKDAADTDSLRSKSRKRHNNQKMQVAKYDHKQTNITAYLRIVNLLKPFFDTVGEIQEI